MFPQNIFLGTESCLSDIFSCSTKIIYRCWCIAREKNFINTQSISCTKNRPDIISASYIMKNQNDFFIGLFSHEKKIVPPAGIFHYMNSISFGSPPMGGSAQKLFDS